MTLLEECLFISLTKHRFPVEKAPNFIYVSTYVGGQNRNETQEDIFKNLYLIVTKERM